MYHYLKSLGKDCRLVHISDLPFEYEFLNTDDVIETYDADRHNDWIANAELALIFDVGDYRRMRQIGDELEAHNIHVVNIDHHPDLKNASFNESYINLNAAATGDMI